MIYNRHLLTKRETYAKGKNVISVATACLALSVYFESRNQSDIGQQYVAHVVVNRSENNDMCSVVFEKNQFSWTNNIKHSGEPAVMIKSAIKKIDEPKQWIKSIEVAKEVMNRKHDITNGAKFFNKRKLGVRFKTKVKPIIIGQQVFY